MTETITIEKQVWESTLNRSMVLQAENAKLKELLKECKMPLKVYNELFGNKAELLTKIDEVLNANKA